MSSAEPWVDEISPEQLIAEHTFVYVLKGVMEFYDGSRNSVLESGDCGIARRNRLVRFKKGKRDGELEKVFISFDERFLRWFQDKHQTMVVPPGSGDTILRLQSHELVAPFIQSVLPYYAHGKITGAFSDLKREELLLILLGNRPDLSGVFFDFNIPAKVNLEEFMNRNYTFNVSLQRYAYLTGRSLSAFKRDFSQVFHQTPARWLVRKRLEEAYFLIRNRHKSPTDIYIDLGFENLSHFSFAFKKHFGLNPSTLVPRNAQPPASLVLGRETLRGEGNDKS